MLYDDGFGAGSDFALDVGGVEVVRLRVDVSEHRLSLCPADGGRDSDTSEGLNDDFVVGADAKSLETSNDGLATGAGEYS